MSFLIFQCFRTIVDLKHRGIVKDMNLFEKEQINFNTNIVVY